MKLRCKTCRGKLGLGFVSKHIFEPEKLWYRRYRFCGVRCRDNFLKRKAEELARRMAVASLFRPP